MRLSLLLAAAVTLVAPDTSGPRRRPIRSFLVSVSDEGVARFDLKGTKTWFHPCRPYDASDLPGGNVLIVERYAGRVVEVTPDGREVWEKSGLEAPVDADRLPGGNTLILENGANRVIELTPEGRTALEITGLNNAFDAQRLPNGHTVVADSGNNRVAEFDARGMLVREKTGLDFPNSLMRLPDGSTLITTYTRGSVVLFDLQGTLLWERRFDGTLYSVDVDRGDLWVSDGTGGRVSRLSAQGAVLEEISLGKRFLDLYFSRR